MSKVVKVPMYNRDENIEFGLGRIGGYPTESTKPKEIIFKMNRNAIIGFGESLISIYYSEYFKDTEEGLSHIHVDSMRMGYITQTFGFCLNGDSCDLVVQGNLKNISKRSNLHYENLVRKKIVDGDSRKLYKNIYIDEDDHIIQTFQIGFNNIAELKVLSEGKEIYCDVLLQLERKTMLTFGKELLRLANNYREGDYYRLSHVCGDTDMYNMGVHLVEDSDNLTIVCSEFDEYDNIQKLLNR